MVTCIGRAGGHHPRSYFDFEIFFVVESDTVDVDTFHYVPLSMYINPFSAKEEYGGLP